MHIDCKFLAVTAVYSPSPTLCQTKMKFKSLIRDDGQPAAGKPDRAVADAVSEPLIKSRKESPLAGQTGRTKTAWLSLRPACKGYRRSVRHPFQVKFIVLKPAPYL